MRTNLHTLLFVASMTLLQSACIFGARTPLKSNQSDENNQNNINKNNVQCAAIPVCPSGFTESPACTRDGRECKQVSLCGATITCVEDEACTNNAPSRPTCPPEYVAVEACPPDSDCTRVDGFCGASTYCARQEHCPDGGAFACPEHYTPVASCDPDQETCLATRTCGQVLYCQYDPPPCESMAPQCPEGSSPIQNCDDDVCPACDDGACFTKMFCDTALVCKKSDCRPLDAKVQGACRQELGYSWDGQRCERLFGCECVGAACDDLFPDEATCQRANLFCEHTPLTCEARNNASFPRASSTISGYAWDGRQCVGLLGQGTCQGPDCPYVYSSLTQCQETFRHCQGDGCEAQEAIGVGLCDAYFGAVFNGSACENISGCSCRGADCDALYMDVESCNDATRQCAR